MVCLSLIAPFAVRADELVPVVTEDRAAVASPWFAPVPMAVAVSDGVMRGRGPGVMISAGVSFVVFDREWNIGTAFLFTAFTPTSDVGRLMTGFWLSVGPTFRLSGVPFEGAFVTPKIVGSVFTDTLEIQAGFDVGYSWVVGRRWVFTLTVGTSAGYSNNAKGIYAEGFFTTKDTTGEPGVVVGVQADLLRIGGRF